MKLADYIAKAKRILKEDAGSEGMVYLLSVKGNLAPVDNEILKITEIEHKEGLACGRVEFTFARDYGFALNSIKAVLGDIDIATLELIY